MSSSLAEGGPVCCEEARAMAQPGLPTCRSASTKLAGLRDALTQRLDTCDQPRADRDCPILHDIETAAAIRPPSTRK
jgi:hypothetical protein